MRNSDDDFELNRKVRLLMTKKELELLEMGAVNHLKRQSTSGLKELIERARDFRDKYRDLTRRQKAKTLNSLSLRTIEKAEAFDRLVGVFRDQYIKTKNTRQTKQAKLDQQEHYDIDGVSQKDGQISFPQVVEFKKKSRGVSKRNQL